MSSQPSSPRPEDTHVLTERLGARLIDGLIDLLIGAIILFIFVFIGLRTNTYQTFLSIALVISAAFIIGYEFLLEGVWNGQTIGKRLLGLEVRMDDGRPCTVKASATRSLAEVIELITLYLLAFASMQTSPWRKRLGDRLAHTIVTTTTPTETDDVTETEDPNLQTIPTTERRLPNGAPISRQRPPSPPGDSDIRKTSNASEAQSGLRDRLSRSNPFVSGESTENTGETGNETISRARQAVTSTLADQASEADWIESLLGRLTEYAKRYDVWLAQSQSEQSVLDRWAADASAWFRERETTFESVRETINHARHEESWDLYLAHATIYAILTGLAGALSGLVLTGLLAYAGVFAQIHTNVGAPTGLKLIVYHYRIIIAGVLLTLFLGGLFAGATFMLFYYLPVIKKDTRSREITHILPYGVTYMYALSRGKMPLVQIINHASEATGPYGAFAEECQLIVREMEYFGRDLQEAMRQTREHTPSDEFAALLNDLGTIFRASQSVTPFLRDKTHEFHERAHDAQEDFLDTLEIFAEFYLISMVLGVLMLVTIVVVMATQNPSATAYLYPLTYILIPGGTFGFYLIIDAMSVDETKTVDVTLSTSSEPVTTGELEAEASELKTARETPSTTAATDGGAGTPATDGGVSKSIPPAAGNTRSYTENITLLEGLATAKRRQRVIEIIRYPFDHPYEKPLAALGWSLPIGIVYLAVALSTGLTQLSSIFTSPIWATTVIAVIPFFIIFTPVTYYYEISNRRQERINKELPAVIRQLSSANEAGMSLSESFAVVGETSSGVLAREFTRLSHALTWNFEFSEGLAELANRLRNPRFTRVASLLIQANTATNDVREVLDAIETDVQNAAELDTEHSRRMFLYVLMAIVGFLVFLAINSFLYATLLTRIAHISSAAQGSQMGSQLGSTFGGSLNLTTYKMLFYHATLVQAVCTAIMGGKFSSDDARDGLKYALVQVLFTTIVFIFVLPIMIQVFA